MLRAGPVREVSVWIQPNLVGGLSPASLFRAPDLAAAGGMMRLQLAHVGKPKVNLVGLRYAVKRPDWATTFSLTFRVRPRTVGALNT